MTWWHHLVVGFVLGIGTGIFIGVTLLRAVVLRAVQVVDKLVTPHEHPATERIPPTGGSRTVPAEPSLAPAQPVSGRAGARGSKTMWDGRTEKILKDRHDKRVQHKEPAD